LLHLHFLSGTVFTQDCTIESLLKKPGSWKESSAVMAGVTATDLATEEDHGCYKQYD
jgi:hypothetical protein